MKEQVKKAVLNSRAFRLAAKLQPPAVAILMYHSVLRDPSLQDDSLGGISHSEASFRAQMEMLAREFRPISLDNVLCHLQKNEDFMPRSVVVTFDDGYADNYDVALPILDQLGVPATFYATVDCIERQVLPWPSRLRFSFRSSKKSDWTDSSGKPWPLTTPDAREKAFLFASDLCCQLSGIAQENFAQQLESELDQSLQSARLPDQAAARMMNYEQLRALASHRHIVGSHTMTHPNMAHIPESDASFELAESKQRLERNLGFPVKHFSYPCPALSPHWSLRTVEQSRAVGYETAVTTNSGLARKGDDPLTLKRIHPTKTLDGLRWNLESAFAGRTV
jgi:peptidoglycan/xylan/chitin deacetylase (PgdA/CDA1 family)